MSIAQAASSQAAVVKNARFQERKSPAQLIILSSAGSAKSAPHAADDLWYCNACHETAAATAISVAKHLGT